MPSNLSSESSRSESRTGSSDSEKSRSRSGRRSYKRSRHKRRRRRSYSNEDDSHRSRSKKKRRKKRRRSRTSLDPKLKSRNVSELLHYNPTVFNQKITKPARRIYVGNLPMGPSYTEAFFLNFFIREINKKQGDQKYRGVVSFWVAPEKSFGFCEFASVTDADRASVELNGLMIGGKQIRCKRPSDYEPVPAYLKDYYVGGPDPYMPPGFDISKYKHIIGIKTRTPTELMKKVEVKEMPIPGRGSLRTQLKMLNSNVKKTEIRRTRPHETSRGLRLKNMISGPQLLAPLIAYKEKLRAIRNYISQFGEIEALFVPRPGELATDAGVGNVYVLYAEIDDSENAKEKMEKNGFLGQTLEVDYFEETKFATMQLH